MEKRTTGETFEAIKMYAGEGRWFIEFWTEEYPDRKAWVKNKDIWIAEECYARDRMPPVSASFDTDEKEAKYWADWLNQHGRRVTRREVL